jgi:hypothetical protein
MRAKQREGEGATERKKGGRWRVAVRRERL